MLKLSALLIGIVSSATLWSQAPSTTLSTMHFNGASVLPYTHFTPGGEKYFILSREAYGSDKDTWDAFGGSRDPHETPEQTAAREFEEETALTLISPGNAKRYIDPHNSHTSCVIAHRTIHFVCYLTHFDAATIQNFEKKFYRARKKALDHKYREKDALARVAQEDIKKAVAQWSTGKQRIRVQAEVLQADGTFKKETIVLRPLISSLLYSYYYGSGVKCPLNPKVFYY